MRKLGTTGLAIVLLYVVVYLLPLGVRPLHAPDETRYAEIPREMLVSGDWVVPRLNGLLYLEKPPLGYWVTAVSLRLLGANRFALRLPSALAVGISALLLFLLARRGGLERSTAILSSAVYLTCLGVFAVGITNILDSLFAMLLTASLAAFFAADSSSEPRTRRWWLALVGFCCGLAFLAKGFLGLVVPVLVAVPYLLLERRFVRSLKDAWIPLVTMIATVLPWSGLVHRREPDFWRYFVWVEHVSRFLNPEGVDQHPEPLWYFLPLLAASMVLWVPLVPAIASGLRRRPFVPSVLRYAWCWLVLPLLFFSLSEGKRGTYILPCFPPLALLVAVGLERYTAKGGTALARVGAALFGGGVIVVAGVVLAGQAGWVQGLRWYAPAEQWKWLLLVTALAIWGLVAFATATPVAPRLRLLLYCLAPAPFLLCAHFVIPQRALAGGSFEQFLDEHAAEVPAEAVLVTDRDLVQSVCWSLKRSDAVLLEETGELAYGLQRAEQEHRLLRRAELPILLNERAGKAGVVLILTRRRMNKLRQASSVIEALPAPVFEVAGDGVVLSRFERVAASGSSDLPG